MKPNETHQLSKSVQPLSLFTCLVTTLG